MIFLPPPRQRYPEAYTQRVKSYEAHFLSAWESVHEISAGTEGSTVLLARP